MIHRPSSPLRRPGDLVSRGVVLRLPIVGGTNATVSRNRVPVIPASPTSTLRGMSELPGCYASELARMVEQWEATAAPNPVAHWEFELARMRG